MLASMVENLDGKSDNGDYDIACRDAAATAYLGTITPYNATALYALMRWNIDSRRRRHSKSAMIDIAYL